ncbi:MAG: trigger factor [Candidatus Omnitrophica bacterium]|nr:trigger factor [Candidatus Omnitrophota bacterium]
MKTRIKNKEECTKLFQIEIPHEEVLRITEEVYREIKKIAKIPGFRPGFAPQDLLVKHYSKDAKEEVLKRLIPEGYKKAIENHKVIPVSPPRVFNISLEDGKPLTFEAQVDTRPHVKLRNYKKIKITKNRISVTQEEKEESISRLRNAYAKFNDVARPVKKGDYAVCSVEAFAEGKPISKKNDNMWITADKEASLLGLGEQLIGLEKGQTKEIDAKLPDNYPDKKFAGKMAKFKVLVNEVKEKGLPEVDDAFAKTLKMENVETLKKEIEDGLFARKENALKVNMQNQILERLLKDYKFGVPTNMANRQKEVLAKRVENELLQKGIQKEEAETKVKELDAKLAEDARDKIRIYFILDDIAEKEKIEVNEDDIDARIKMIASQAGQTPEDVKKYYEKENLLGGLAEEIKESKTLEFLLGEAEITEQK